MVETSLGFGDLNSIRLYTQKLNFFNLRTIAKLDCKGKIR